MRKRLSSPKFPFSRTMFHKRWNGSLSALLIIILSSLATRLGCRQKSLHLKTISKTKNFHPPIHLSKNLNKLLKSLPKTQWNARNKLIITATYQISTILYYVKSNQQNRNQMCLTPIKLYSLYLKPSQHKLLAWKNSWSSLQHLKRNLLSILNKLQATITTCITY